jgi:large subunit ribosomal protein L18
MGTPQRPRLAVFRSLRHIYAQIVDDLSGRTLASASSLKMRIASGNREQASQVGRALAEAAVAAGVRQVVLDRRGYRYHGRVQALADAAREGGLEF